MLNSSMVRSGKYSFNIKKCYRRIFRISLYFHGEEGRGWSRFCYCGNFVRAHDILEEETCGKPRRKESERKGTVCDYLMGLRSLFFFSFLIILQFWMQNENNITLNI